ncbi:hypothetical protein ACFLST_00250 [Chloroflexota bacterium]
MNVFSTVVKNLTLVDQYKTSRKAQRVLTIKGEEWIDNTLVKCAQPVTAQEKSLLAPNRDGITTFLSNCDGKPRMKHSHFRAIRAFCNWVTDNGHVAIAPCYQMTSPEAPDVVLSHPSLTREG